MKLCISLPTRGRPDRILDTVRTSIANWTDPNTVMWIMTDEDDIACHDALTHANFAPPCGRVEVSVRSREDTIAEKWNRALELEPDADIYLAGADDDPYTTPGYDTKILEAAKRFPDGIGMVYGHMANASFSRAVAPTRGFVQKLGWMFPTHFPYWFVDHWTDDLAKLIGRISFANIMTDQTRPGKTQELRQVEWWATWFDAAYLMRRAQAHAIINSPEFQETDWRKEILLTHHPLIEFHSRWTNTYVRQMAAGLNQWSGLSNQDERYQRVKQRAELLVPKLLYDYNMFPAEADYFRKQLLPEMIPNLKQAWAA